MTEQERPQEPTPRETTSRQARARTRSLVQDDVPHEAVARRTPERISKALDLAKTCARIADDNRAKDIVILDLRHATAIVDFFVIATASSRRQSHAIASEIDAEMKKRGELKLGIEGSEEGRWALIDYGDFVVHVFSPNDRSYYALDDIWGDAARIDWQDGSSSTPNRPSPTSPNDESEAETAQ